MRFIPRARRGSGGGVGVSELGSRRYKNQGRRGPRQQARPRQNKMVAKLVGASVLAGLVALRGAAGAEPALFESRQLTPPGEYTGGIEGPAVDAAGTLYVVNFGRQGTIGKLRPGATRSELFTTLPRGTIDNAIPFHRESPLSIPHSSKP